MTTEKLSVQDWLHSPTYLYEQSLFVYFLINCVLYIVAISSLAFCYVSTFTDFENLALNFFWFTLICLAFCFPDFWYRIIFRKKKYLFKDQQIIQEHLDSLDNAQEKQEILAILKEKGMLPMSRKQQVALGFLFMVLVFDEIFKFVWVNSSGILIWQPDWVLACIEWVKSNLTLPPIYQDTKLFMLEFGDSSEGLAFKEDFGSEQQFLQHPTSNTYLFYHFIRVVLFVPIVFAVCVVLWSPLQKMGNNDKDPNNIMSIMGIVRALAWSLVMGFFGISMTLMAIIDPLIYMNYIRGNGGVEVMIGMCLFIAIAVRFFAGWFGFFKHIFNQCLGAIR